MDNLPSFSIYAVILAFAIASLATVGAAINLRAQEWAYYHELALQSVDIDYKLTLCGGPGRTNCTNGHKCKLPDGKVPPAIGMCELIIVK